MSKVPTIQNILNEVYHDTTGFTPTEIHMNKKPQRFWEQIFTLTKQDITIDKKLILVDKRIKYKGKKRAERHANNYKFVQYHVNDLVLIKAEKNLMHTQKLQPNFWLYTRVHTD